MRPDTLVSVAGAQTESLRGSFRRSFTVFVHQMARDRLFLAGSIIVCLAIVLAIIGPWIVPYDPAKPEFGAFSKAPSVRHWFGTDTSGLDVFSRVVVSARTDVSIGLAATLFSFFVGTSLGLVLSYFSGAVSQLAMRLVDIVQAFPLFVLAMVLVVTAGRSLVALVLVLGFLNVTIHIRLMRSQVLGLKNRPFVEAARAVGVSETVIAFRHIYPNAIAPSLIQASVSMGWAIILTAGLSFIGAGVRPPTPEWGSMIAIGANQMAQGEWWSAAFPGIAMSLTVFGFAAFGEGLSTILRRGE